MTDRHLPATSKYRSHPERPVDDAERDSLNTRLNDAFAAGTVDADTYQALLDQVYAARTLGELEPVVTQLPAAATYSEPTIVGEGGRLAPGELSEARPAGPLMARLVMITTIGGLVVLVLAALILLLGS